MKRMLFGLAVLVGLFAFAGSSAEASSRRGHFHQGHGYGHGHGNSFHGYSGHYQSFYNPSYGNWGYSQPYWHDTSHYDYHPTRIVPHGNHYDVIPGHYHLHHSGHWHH
ncbi:MAG: hypothetical protein WD066_10135 [Planctomycetaceae bacterium]